MPSPPPTPKSQELTPKPESQPEQQKQKPTIMIFGKNLGDERRAVDSALNNKRINFDSNREMEAWMAQLRKADNTTHEGRVPGETKVNSIRPPESERC
jgi:hypothetical protein